MSNSGNLTVVVVALLGGRNLEACLRHLEAGTKTDPADMIVVRPFLEAGEDIDDWRHNFPRVGFLESGPEPVPLRRQLGAEACDTEFVAFLEDTTWPAPGWRTAILAAFDDPEVAAVGGPVEISPTLSHRACALAVSEYGRFHPTVLGMPANGVCLTVKLPGNNLAYRRDPLLALLRHTTQGLSEVQANDQLRRQGARLVLHSEMLATYVGEDTYGYRLTTRLQYGRVYGAGRSAGQSWHKRLGLVAKAALLPIVLSVRALRHGRHALPPAKLPFVAIWIGLMESAWSLGEALGALAGEGRSLQSWR